jgi:hypothetical protein
MALCLVLLVSCALFTYLVITLHHSLPSLLVHRGGGLSSVACCKPKTAAQKAKAVRKRARRRQREAA